MIINSGNLRTLGTGFKASFQRGLGQLSSQRALIATTVSSSNAREEYGWMGKVPGMREWLGDRVLNSIKTYDYSIRNKDWESTVEVERNDIEDDNLGLYGPMMEEMGRAAVRHPDKLIYDLLKAGFTSNCYDGQFFFDTDHPRLDAAGKEVSAANTDGGAGASWFLVDTKRAIMPIIFQERKAPNFVAKDNVDDDNVFFRKKFVYGVDARYNVGYGFWQFIWGSRQALNAANYAAARAAMMGMLGDYDTPLGIMPDTLIVPPSLESAGRKLLNSEYAAGGETNEWKDTAKLEVVPWLA
jgi:phage major head subunit gpT-like protein